MDIDALAAGAAAVISAEVPGIHVMDSPLIMPQPPSFVLSDFTITPHKTMRFASQVDMTFRIIVGHQSPEAGAKTTRGMAGDGAGTPFYAIEKPHILNTGGQTFGGACDDAAITLMRGYRGYTYGGVDFIGFEILVTAIGERAS